jgi:hypothetical protein
MVESATATMKTAVLLAAYTVFAIALYGQSQPKDVAGWDKIKWGMMIAEARAAYSVDTQPEKKDDWTVLRLNPTKMAGVEMGVQVSARTVTEKITAITLWSYFGLVNSASSAGPQDFDTLKTLLSQEYGPPAEEKTERGLNFRSIKTVLWKFPSTSVQMTMEQSASLPHLGNLIIEYTAR